MREPLVFIIFDCDIIILLLTISLFYIIKSLPIIMCSRMWLPLLSSLLLLGCYPGALADTPADCSFEDVKGAWLFYEGHRTGDHAINCDNFTTIIHKTRVTLMYPNIAVDQNDNRGTWTMVYNQGFEVTINGRSYFAFSYYEKDDIGHVISKCGQTFNGWSRDVTVRNWACYRGNKVKQSLPKIHTDPHHHFQKLSSRKYVEDEDLVTRINANQSSWTAKIYSSYKSFSLLDHLRRAGGPRSYMRTKAKANLPNVYSKLKAMAMPQTWDWRNVSGVNYVSPVRNQANCGSCYAFASMATLESRIRILTRNGVKDVYSPQDVVGCSSLSQGCDGGFPYLIAGRYAQDQGVVLEQCYPYEGSDDICRTKSSCTRHYTAKYRYVGGYFGGCNEEEMKLALIRGGPLAVGFEVYDDFMHYSGGVYTHTGLKSKFNPLELTNHAVMVVGYGVTDNGQKYWTVKNSWGTSWGEDGYFRISRGNDECGIESMAVEVVPIP